MAGTLGNASQACLVVSGPALGLIVGTRALLVLGGEFTPMKMSSFGSHADAAVPPVAGQPCRPSESANCLTEGLPTPEESP
jgi:hypothetical protein